jgi:hypothetical protein
MYGKHACRCLPCRLHTSRLREQRRHGGGLADNGFTDRTGTIRRLQALHRLGWSTVEVGNRLGVSRQAVLYWRTYPHPLILRATADRITRVYDQLSAVLPPAGRGTDKTREHATRNGWLPPLAWDDGTIDDPTAAPATTVADHTVIDDTAVEEALAGREVRLTKTERAEAVRRGTARGMSARTVAERLRIAEYTVERDKARCAA